MGGFQSRKSGMGHMFASNLYLLPKPRSLVRCPTSLLSFNEHCFAFSAVRLSRRCAMPVHVRGVLETRRNRVPICSGATGSDHG